MQKQANIKILVCYHKPAKLIKDDIYIPIHLGRALATQASKDGKMSNDDYKWMLDNMIGDDTGENISHLNRYFAEITAIYWAWKNYDKIGNPDYIGLAHYRRLFKDEDVKSVINYDITAVQDRVYNAIDIEHQFNTYHCTDDLYNTLDILRNMYPEYEQDAKKYIKQQQGFYYNMFVMKKEIFFEYCELLFNVLFKLHESIDYDKLSFCNQRMPAYVAERLTGIFITHKSEKNSVNVVNAVFKDVPLNKPVKPVFKNAVCICLSSDDNYAKYLGVTIESIKANRNNKDNYDICVLDGGISELNKNKILKLCEKNFSIRFININGFIDNVDKKIFSLNEHFTIATYFRFFIPGIFSEYKKILYLDCDLVADTDVSTIYNIDLGKYPIGAVSDIEVLRRFETDYRFNGHMPEYLSDVLEMKNPTSYFQAGVLVLDIKKLKDMDFTQKAIDRLIKIKKPLYVDQCVLNSLLDGNYKSIDMSYNVLWQIPIFIHDLDKQLDVKAYNNYMNARKNAKIIHYAGVTKPWFYPDVEMADIWWKYARQTPFYEEFLFAGLHKECHIKTKSRKFEYKRKILFHKFLSIITIGKIKEIQKRKSENYSRLLMDNK